MQTKEVPTINLVVEFHEKFRGPIEHSPTIPSLECRKLRAKLIIEELGEYLEASGFKGPDSAYWIRELMEYVDSTDEDCQSEINMVEAADALADIDYVVAGANLAWGFPAFEIIKHVHDSNMSKLDANGEPIIRADGKILKGPNYWKPDIGSILNKYIKDEGLRIDTIQTR